MTHFLVSTSPTINLANTVAPYRKMATISVLLICSVLRYAPSRKRVLFHRTEISVGLGGIFSLLSS